MTPCHFLNHHQLIASQIKLTLTSGFQFSFVWWFSWWGWHSRSSNRNMTYEQGHQESLVGVTKADGRLIIGFFFFNQFFFLQTWALALTPTQLCV